MRIAILLVATACDYAPERIAAPSDGRDPDAAISPDGASPDASPPDAPALPACAAPPAGCTLVECAGSTSCYYVCATERTWTEARDQCVTDQLGCLATIDTAVEDACLFTAASPIVFPDLVWFGYRQAGGQASPGAGWSWACGTSAYVAPNWGDFEPNDNNGSENGQEDCASLGSGGAWVDIGCGDDRRYICELPR